MSESTATPAPALAPAAPRPPRRSDEAAGPPPPEALGELAGAYGIGPVREVERLPGGKSEHFRLETATGRYVLRRSHAAKTAEATRYEHELVAFLRGHGFPAVEVLPTSGGDDHVALDGALLRLTAWVEGEPFDPSRPRQLRAVGRSLALYHRLVRSFRPSVAPPSAPDLRDRLRAAVEGMPALDGMPSAAARDARLRELAAWTLERARQELALLDALAPELPVLVIHGGCRRGSAVFEGDELSAVLDFDSARPELRALDLAIALHDYGKVYTRRGLEDHKVLLDLDVVAGFMAAYGEEEPVGAAERDAVRAVLAARPLGRALRKCRKRFTGERDVGERDVAKVERELGRVRWIDAHAAELDLALSGRRAPAVHHDHEDAA